MEELQPVISAAAVVEDGKLMLHYSLKNTTSHPIYVFDRLVDKQEGQPVANWAYVFFEGDKAIMGRHVWKLPRGLMVDEPEVPLGRLLPGGKEIAEVVRLDLPLLQNHPYAGLGSPNGTLHDVRVRGIEWRLGWTSAEGVVPRAKEHVDKEELVLVPYYTAITKQRVTALSIAGQYDLPGRQIR